MAVRNNARSLILWVGTLSLLFAVPVQAQKVKREIYQQQATRAVTGQGVLLGFDPIPAGKRLVIEEVTGRIVLNGTDSRQIRAIALLTAKGAGVPFIHLLPVPDSHYSAGGTKEWVFGRSIRQYAQGSFPTGVGDFGVAVNVEAPESSDFIQLDVSISGYLEDV
jgi:hypothetical protein